MSGRSLLDSSKIYRDWSQVIYIEHSNESEEIQNISEYSLVHKIYKKNNASTKFIIKFKIYIINYISILKRSMIIEYNTAYMYILYDGMLVLSILYCSQ